MRLSTSQFYYQNTLQLSNKQSDLNEQIAYLSSGKRVITAEDDAVAFGTLSGYQNELSNIEKYKRNIIQAENRNTLQEISFSNAEGVMQQFKQIFIQANNGTLSSSDLSALADLADNGLSQLLDIANSKDETGGYIFSGYQIDKEPFSIQPGNNVSYQGDGGTRELQIAKNVIVQTNQPGDEAFQKVKNAIGDFTPVYNTNTSGISVNQANIVDRGAYDAVTNPPDYNFSFTSATDLTVTDGLGATVYTTAAYVPGQTVAFNGVEVQISGNPLPGDDFDLTPQENISMFNTIKSAIDWMNVGTTPVNDAQHVVDYDEILSQINYALNHITSNQATAGIRMKLIDDQESNHADNEIVLTKGKSHIEDLDFSKAISKFEQSKIALQAAQQTFTQVKDLSLFNYL